MYNIKYFIEITKEQFDDCKEELNNIINFGNNIIELCMLPFENRNTSIDSTEIEENKTIIKKIKLRQNELLKLLNE